MVHNNSFGNICLFGLLLLAGLSSCKTTQPMSSTQVYAFRLKPGEDLKKGIQQFAEQKQITAGWISTGVGSLTHYNIRFANQPEASSGQGHFEIVSLTGTVSINGSHLHLSVSDSTGRTLGGHLADGNLIYTTAEIVITASRELEFNRPVDPGTGWKELEVKEKKQE